MIYPEESFLQLSGLQHFKFCRRQWALIHIENQWAENYRTTDGAILHERAHDKDFTESRGDLLITRDMRIFSPNLGVSGACDVLEFHHGVEGIPLKGKEGLWRPYPVEYKRGKPKQDTTDAPELRQEVKTLIEEMHALYERGWTPKVKPTKACNACSLKELCLPKLMRKRSVADYLRAHLEVTP